MKSVLIGLTALAILAAVGAKRDQVSYCGFTLADTADWVRQDESGFSFLLPPGFALLRRGGIDSHGATWQRQNHRIFYDYGSYGNPLTEASVSPGVSNYRNCDQPLNGAVRVVLFEREGDRRGSFVGAYWENIVPPPIPVHLSMLAYSIGEPLDSTAVSEYLTVLRSVQFD